MRESRYEEDVQPSPTARFGRLAVAGSIVLASIAVAACGGVDTDGGKEPAATSGASGQKTSSEGSGKIDEKAFLSAPEGAEVIEPKPGVGVTGPITKKGLVLPFNGQYPVPDGPIGDAKKTYKFCFSQGLVGNPWTTAQKESVMLEAARHPNVKVLYYNNNDASQQVNDLKNCQNQKVDAALVWPQTIGALTPQVKAMCDAGMTIVGMERTVATDCFKSWIYLDADHMVESLADAIAKDIGGKGVVVESQGTPGSAPQIQRHEGFIKRMAEKYPDIKVVQAPATDFGQTTGYQSALDFLKSGNGQNVDAWYVQYSEIGIGVAKAMKQLKRSGIPIYGIGDDKNAVRGILDGSFAALTPATPLHGDVALRLAILAVEGKSVPHDVLLRETQMVTKENAAEFLKTTWGT